MFKKLLSAVTAGIIAFAGIPLTANAQANSDMRDITTMELVHDMGIGINLGNTFESCGDWIGQWSEPIPKSYETAWGSPEITENMIKGYADSGFDTLRVPVAWSNLMGDNYTVSTAYIDRVKTVVEWALKYDMYVIVNLHYDNGWLSDLPTDKTNVMNKYSRIWEQISDAFKDYDDHLVFESQNEELGWDSVWNQWGGTAEEKAKSYALVNEVNQKFVDIVRNSGGNNPKRHLLISGYKTDIDLTCDPLFEMPNDPANRMAVSVHYYTPFGFTHLTQDESWAKALYSWGTDSDLAELDSYMNKMKSAFVDKGIPVIIGEYGMGCDHSAKDADSIRLFIKSVCEKAYGMNMCPVLWDITDENYNRNTCTMNDPVLNEMLVYVKDNSKPTKPTEPEIIFGDVNGDGEFNIADIITMQKWIVAIPNADFKNWQAGDLYKDNRIDIFDLCLMKRKLIYKN